MSSSRYDEWSDKIDSDDGKEYNRKNKKCKFLESAKDSENIATLSVQSKAGTSGLYASNRLKQQQKRKTSCSNDTHNQSKQPELKRRKEKSNDGDSELDNHRSKKFEISEVHPASGLKTSLHGVAYQLKLLMLCLKRGIDQGYPFRMTTEMDEAEKFDDLVFQYEENGEILLRFLQAKHKLDESEKISIKDLLTETDKKLNLQKYFNSYCKIKRNPKFSNKNIKIKDLIICTNIGFKLGDKRRTLTLGNDIFDTEKDETILKTDLLRFRKDFVGREEIVSVLKNIPDVIRLAKELANCVSDGKSTKNVDSEEDTNGNLLKLYQFALVGQVIDGGSKKFQREFVTDAKSLSSEARDFRKVFEKVFKDFKSGSEMCLDVSNFWEVIGEKELSLSDNFGKLDAKLGSIKVFVAELVDVIEKSRNNNDPYVELKAKNFKIPKNKDKLAKYTLIEKNDEIHFRHEFLCDDPLPGNLNEFRKQLKAQVKDLDKLRFVIKNFLKSGLPSITDIDGDIDSFLDKLLFAVNQPNEMKLSSIIDAEIGDCKGVNLIDTEHLASRFQKYLLDWMKDKKGRFLTYVEGKKFFDEMRKKLTTIQLTWLTREYSSRMKQINIRFTEEKIDELRKFLEPGNTTQLFILMSMPDTILGLIQVHQILKKIPNYQKDDGYIFIGLDSFLSMQGPVIDVFGSRSRNLLIIEYGFIEVREQTSYRKLLEAVKSNNPGKIILITNKDNELVDTLRSTFNDRYVEKKIGVDGLLDLENRSRNKLLKERKVKFQGQEVPLCKLIVDEESMNLINAEALSKLINNEALEIGKPLHDLGDVEDYYICRTFQRREAIDRSFLDDNLKFYVTTSNQLMDFNSERNQDIVVISDNNKLFKELGNDENYKKHNIHWLKSENRHFVWQESKGALSNLRNFVDRKSVKSFVPGKVTDISEKIVITAAGPGMGKSTLLTYLSLQTKKFESNLWVAKINLSSDCSGKLMEMVKKRIWFNDEKTIDFLLASVKFTSEMPEYKFLKYCYKTGNMILLFDGYDEISPHYNDKVIELLKFLKSTRIKKIWVTTRPYDIKTRLEDELGSFSYVLQEFSENDQRLFLKKFWKARLNSDNFHDGRAQVFIDTLLDSFSKSINDRERRFISIPLQIRMIADVCKDTFQNFNNSGDENISDLKEKLGKNLELLNLYENFFDVMFEDIYFCEKRPGFDRTTVCNILTMVGERDKEINKHKILALQSLYPNNSMIPKERVAGLIEDIKQSKNKTGIIDRVIDDRPVFVHQSFAEYFVALWFSKNWREVNVKQFLMKHIFNKESIVIMNFLDRMLAKDEPGSSQTPESYIKYHEGESEYKLHKAVLNNDVSEVKGKLNKDNGLLDTTDNAGRTPVHLAAARGHIKIARSLLKVVKEGAYHSKTHPLSVKDELFQWTPLAYADKNNHWAVIELLLQMGAASEDMIETKKNIKKVGTLLHKAAEKGYLKIAEFLLAEGVMIDARDEEKSTPLHLAALNGHLEVVKYFSNDQNANLEAVNGKGNTPLHCAALKGNLDIVKYFIDEKNADYKVVNKERNTPYQVAIEIGNFEVAQHLHKKMTANSKNNIRVGNTSLPIDTCIDNLTLIKYLFEGFVGEGTTPLHCAVFKGDLKMVEHFVEDKNVNFKTVDGIGNTLLHLAAMKGHFEIVEYFVDKKKVNFEAIDGDGSTPLHWAAIGGNLQIVKYFVDAKKANFEAIGGDGSTPLHWAALGGNLQIVKYFVDAKKANFEAVNVNKHTPLHYAVLNGNLDVVKYLVDEKRANFEVVNTVGTTLLHIAAMKNNLEFVKYLVDEKKANFEVADSNGRTALHLVASMGWLKIVKYLVDDKKANLEVVDGKGNTPLHYAAGGSNLKIVKYLVDEKKANFEAVGENGRTPMHFATLKSNLEMVEYLVDKKKANFEAVDRGGNRPSHFAAERGDLEIVKYLVNKKNADIEAVNGEGNTPLHFAAQGGNLQIVKYLIDDKKANFEAVNVKKNRPLHYAVSKGNLDVVNYLVDKKKG